MNPLLHPPHLLLVRLEVVAPVILVGLMRRKDSGQQLIQTKLRFSNKDLIQDRVLINALSFFVFFF
jgi:hypothetical protein